MSITASNRAAGVTADSLLMQFSAGANVLARNILVIGTPLSTSTGWTANVPQLITSPQDGINRYGAGSVLARLLSAAFIGTGYTVRIWAFPQTETGAAATGVITPTVITPAAGSFNLYVNGTAYNIVTSVDDTATTISDTIRTALAADANCPVTAAGTTTVTLTAKSKGLYGNFINLSAACQPGDTLPSGVSVAFTAMASGTGVPTVSTALTAGLGAGSAQNILPNNQGVTGLVHGYVQDSVTIGALSTYNEANYDGLVARPFRVFMGDTAATLSTLTTLGTANITDRTNGVIPAPGSLTHPCELAAIAMGVIEAQAAGYPQRAYVNMTLPTVDPGYAGAIAGTRWTDQYSNRDTAVQAGISTTLCQGSVVTLQNVLSFYHPASVPASSNAFSDSSNVCKIQNMLAATIANFSGPKWQNFTVVLDTSGVTDPTARQFARDVQSVTDDWIQLAQSFRELAWIYDDGFTITALKDTTQPAIVARTDGTGFTCVIPFILSGVGGIITNTLEFDINVSAV